MSCQVMSASNKGRCERPEPAGIPLPNHGRRPGHPNGALRLVGRYRTAGPSASTPQQQAEIAGQPPVRQDASGSRIGYTELLDELRARNPTVAQAAANVLAGMSMLGTSGVPEQWLYRVVRSRRAARSALAELRDKRLLNPVAGGPSVGLDPLVGQVIRADQSTATVLPDEVTAALTILSNVAIDDTDPGQRRETHGLLARQLAEIRTQPQARRLGMDPRLLPLVLRAAWQASQLGDPHTVLALSGYTATLRRRLGATDPRVLAFDNLIAFAHRSAGDPIQAIQLYEPLLAAAQRQLGSHDALVISIRRGLRAARQAANHLVGTVELLGTGIARLDERELAPQGRLAE